MVKTLLVVILTLTACAPPLRVLRYHNRNLIVARPEIVDAFCSDTDGHWDDGRPRAKGEPVGGCYSALPSIWLKEPLNGGTVIHEERHFDCDQHSKNPECGRDPKKEGYK